MLSICELYSSLVNQSFTPLNLCVHLSNSHDLYRSLVLALLKLVNMALRARLRSYAEPAMLIVLSLFFLVKTILTKPSMLVLHPSKFRSFWFSEFWKTLGPKMAKAPYQLPYISKLMSRARGTVLELGPGIGSQSKHFHPEQIDHVYGAEPNAYLHDQLRETSHAAGIRNYTVLPAGAQPSALLPALKTAGLLDQNGRIPQEGIFDTIVTIKSLCSAPPDELEDTIKIVQRLLKPGGEFVFFEHVHSHDDHVTAVLVYITNLIWPWLMGGCRLDGKLDAILRADPGWRSTDIQNITEYHGFEPIRYVKGVCVAS